MFSQYEHAKKTNLHHGDKANQNFLKHADPFATVPSP